jgi:hypothetical protein
MRVIRTNDSHEAHLCRLAQYLGLPKSITLSGSTLYGLVRSVKEEAGPLWIVTIIPTERKVFSFRPPKASQLSG